MAESKGFPQILEDASRLPDIDEKYFSDPFSGFKPAAGDLVKELAPEVKSPVIPKYNYRVKSQRFIIGGEVDDSIAYDAIMTSALAGEIIVRLEERTFTKEGDLIIFVSWMIELPAKKAQTPSKDAD